MGTIDSIRKQIAEIKQREAELKARLRETQRKAAERRQHLIGTAVLKELDAHPDSELSRHVLDLLEKTLIRNQDRELFGLKSREAQSGVGEPEGQSSAVTPTDTSS